MSHKQQINAQCKPYRQEHADEKREGDRQYRQDNREKVLARKKQYRIEHAEELAAKQRAYYLEHRNEVLQYSQIYYQTERGIVAKRASAHNRRAHRKKATGKHTTAELRQLFEQQQGRCYYCHIELKHSRNSWHADHIIPLSKGASNDISNIVIACPTCNRAKHDKLPDEWQPEGGEAS